MNPRSLTGPQHLAQQQVAAIQHPNPPQAMTLNPSPALPGTQVGSRKRPARHLQDEKAAAPLLPRPQPAAAAAAVAASLGPPNDGMPPPGRKRRRSSNHASLIRAKNIDVHKRDPEEDSPPNETEDERRRRRERWRGGRASCRMAPHVTSTIR